MSEPLMQGLEFWVLGAQSLEPWLEWLAVVITLLAVRFSVQGRTLSWPLNIAASLLYALVFLGARLLALAALQAVFVIAAVHGWREWRQHGQQGQLDRVVIARPPALAGATLVILALSGVILAISPASQLSTWARVTEATVTAASVVAQWAMARRWLQCWPLWLLINLASVCLFCSQALWLTALVYLVLMVMAGMGWRDWSRIAARAGGQGL